MNSITKILGDRLLVMKFDRASSSLVIPETVENQDAHFECVVTAVGDKLSEDIKPGDRLLVKRMGSQEVIHHGVYSHLISTLDVVGVLS